MQETMLTANAISDGLPYDPKTKLCDKVKPVDKKSTNLANVEYDTFIDGVDMTVSADPDEQVCGGVIAAAKEASGKMGADIMDTVAELNKLTMGRLVVNETKVVKKGPITTMTKM